ncbi:MAG: DNA-binding response regulator [Herbinix sp.]|jgi:DNA-binding response OmpR family regulator|nr:DNA-binding response regulator [Herbinix sp.]
MAYKLLLVEDDAQIREIITDYFTQKSGETFDIDSASTGMEGQEKSMEKEYDVVLLDIMLPEVNGLTICRELRKNSDVPIVFITAKNSESDKLLGYQLGCDDYISKPFSLAELYAKITALIRRTKGTVRNDMMIAGRIKLNPHLYTVLINEEEVILAPKEFTILKILMENCGRIVSRESLLIRIWGYDYEGNDRVVDNHIKKLRKSLGKASGQLKTVIKRGYKLEG